MNTGYQRNGESNWGYCESNWTGIYCTIIKEGYWQGHYCSWTWKIMDFFKNTPQNMRYIHLTPPNPQPNFPFSSHFEKLTLKEWGSERISNKFHMLMRMIINHNIEAWYVLEQNDNRSDGKRNSFKDLTQLGITHIDTCM